MAVTSLVTHLLRSVSLRASRHTRHQAALFAVSLTLGGCGGGSGTEAILGGDQDPDPVIVDFALAYVARPIRDGDGANLLSVNPRDPARFRPGAELRIRDRASPSSAELVITAGLFEPDVGGAPAQYDIRDLSVSYDGLRLLFGLRAPRLPNAPEEDQPTWNIWVYDHETRELRRVIESDITAEAGQDLAPRFLPDGRILFASTRQRQARAILLDEGKPQFTAQDEDRQRPAFALHVMTDDGSEIRQITFSPSGDLYPAVLGDGRVVFSRWDNVTATDRISLYSVQPDGRNLQLLYGIHSHESGPHGTRIEFVETAELPDGRLLGLLRPFGESARQTALPVAIDTANFIDNEQPTFGATGLLGPAQEPLFGSDLVLDDLDIAEQGRYAVATPLFDGSPRTLVAWSQCRLEDPQVTDPPRFVACTPANLADPRYIEAPPLYGIWMRDNSADTQQPVVVGQEGLAISDIAVLAPRTAPPVLLDGAPGIDLDPDLVEAGAGALHVRSVYDFAGTSSVNIEAVRDPAATAAAARPARFLRLVKAVSMPDDDLVELPGTAFGRSTAQLMREVVGYAMIEPDGSVMVRVPADVAFWPEVLDANGRRIGNRHQNWLHVRAGETLSCNGCHTPTSLAPHGRLDAEPPSANPGAPTTGSPFPNASPALLADAGESMAEVRARILGIPAPDMDLVFTDLWTDSDLRALDEPFAYRYASLATSPPVDPGCSVSWTASCRITINYETHIHPLWSVDRPVFDTDGVTELENHTCTGCHAPVDDMQLPMVPPGQLDLSDGPSADQPAHFLSYRELLFPDNRQIVENNVLIDEFVPVLDDNGQPVFQVDVNGDLILDADGNRIPVMTTVAVQPPLSVAGARASPRFFARFAAGADHAAYLTPAELKLLSEWIDIGGQYYNDPFAVPQD